MPANTTRPNWLGRQFFGMSWATQPVLYSKCVTLHKTPGFIGPMVMKSCKSKKNSKMPSVKQKVGQK